MFNPIKQDKDGVRAMRVIWSTKTIDMALKGLEEGRKLVANPFYDNNTKLLKGDLNFQRTKEEVEEFKKCMNDVVYFGNVHCQLMTPEGIQHIKLRDYQEKYLRHLEKNRLSIYLSCRQSSKCVSELTEVDVQIDWKGDTKREKYWKKYWNKEEKYYTCPMFELINLYREGWRWKIKYNLLKILKKLEDL